jgi:hypothetical protein
MPWPFYGESIKIIIDLSPSNKTLFSLIFFLFVKLEFFESFLVVGAALGHFQDVVADSFTEWTALTHGHNISNLYVPRKKTTNNIHQLPLSFL